MTAVTFQDLKAWNSLEKEERIDKECILNGARLRLVSKGRLPTIKDAASFDEDVLVFDLPSVARAKAEQSMEVVAGTPPIEKRDDFGGSPLKFDFLDVDSIMKIDPSKGQRTFFGDEALVFPCNPMPFGQAVKYRHTVQLDQSLSALPLVFLVDGRDVMKTSMLTAHREKNADAQGHARFLEPYCGKVEEDLRRLSLRFSALDASSRATAAYNILSTPHNGNWTAAVPASMQMRFSWRAHVTPTTYFASPASSAKTVIRCAPGWKDHRVVLYPETLALEHLLSLAQALTNDVPVMWPTDKAEEATVAAKITELIATCTVKENDEFAARFVDFTEHLWEVLRRCTSQEHLVAGFKLVFDALRAVRINTVLHQDNKSTIARLIRDSLAGDLHLPRLEAKTPIQLLLEIGLEKFRRDLVQKFVSESLVTSPCELNVWLKASGAPEEMIWSLLPLHLGLQTVIEMCRHLDLGSHAVAALTRRVLNKYTASRISDFTTFFSTEVQFTEVKPTLLQCYKPCLWMNETTYSQKDVLVAKTITQFTRKCGFSHLEDLVNHKSQAGENEEEIEEEKEERDYRKAYVGCVLTTSYNKTRSSA